MLANELFIIRAFQSAVFFSVFYFVTTDTQGYFFAQPLLSKELSYVVLFLFVTQHYIVTVIVGHQFEPLIFRVIFTPIQFLTGIESNTDHQVPPQKPSKPTKTLRGKVSTIPPPKKSKGNVSKRKKQS